MFQSVLSGEADILTSFITIVALLIIWLGGGWLLLAFLEDSLAITQLVIARNAHSFGAGSLLVYGGTLLSASVKNTYPSLLLKYLTNILCFLLIMAGALTIIFIASGEYSRMIYFTRGLMIP